MKAKSQRRYNANSKSKAWSCCKPGDPVDRCGGNSPGGGRKNDILKKCAVILGTKPQPNSEP